MLAWPENAIAHKSSPWRNLAKASLTLNPPNGPNNALSPAEPPGINTHGPLDLLPLRISPNPVLLKLPIEPRVLIPPQPIDPPPANLRRVQHHIDLLALEPALRVLVARADDADALVRDEELDVARAPAARLHEGHAVVLGHVPVVVQVFGALWRELGEELGRDGLVVAALFREEFALGEEVMSARVLVSR